MDATTGSVPYVSSNGNSAAAQIPNRFLGAAEQLALTFLERRGDGSAICTACYRGSVAGVLTHGMTCAPGRMLELAAEQRTSEVSELVHVTDPAAALEYNPDWPPERKQAYADHVGEVSTPSAPEAAAAPASKTLDVERAEKWLRDSGYVANHAGMRYIAELLHDYSLTVAQPSAEGDGWIAGSGVSLISAERKRQVESEGWTPEHDDLHAKGQLSLAACGYASLGSHLCHPNHYSDDPLQPPIRPRSWPWSGNWWKPSSDPIRNLVKAGALIAAEIDRLQRAAPRAAAAPQRAEKDLLGLAHKLLESLWSSREFALYITRESTFGRSVHTWLTRYAEARLGRGFGVEMPGCAPAVLAVSESYSEPWSWSEEGGACFVLKSDGLEVALIAGDDALSGDRILARRIAACVNACAGKSTEELEAEARAPQPIESDESWEASEAILRAGRG